MCDCYGHKCDHPGCEETISIHLQDFETSREEVDVFCYKHLGDSSEGELWDYESDEWDDWDGPPPLRTDHTRSVDDG